jgi:hypothetical protein
MPSALACWYNSQPCFIAAAANFAAASKDKGSIFNLPFKQ